MKDLSLPFSVDPMPPDPTAEQKARDSLAANPFPTTPWVTVAEDGIVIATGYSEALQRLLRWVPRAKWRSDKRAWLVPLAGAEAVRAVLPEILRLAESARELNEAEPAPPAASDAFDEAATLLDGREWRGARDAAAGAALVEALRRKAQALAGAADRIEASLRAAARGGGPRPQDP